MLPVLKEYSVHVRVSWDAIGPENDKVRPINPDYAPKATSSGACAEIDQIRRCLDAGLSVTVQTVVSRRNNNKSVLNQLRRKLGALRVRHWVLHIAIEGGLARRTEQMVRIKSLRRGGIVPGVEVYEVLMDVLSANDADSQKMDIRCTDTNNTPNSVLLIDSTGDLYTEGFAHNGKVRLFDASRGRPRSGDGELGPY